MTEEIKTKFHAYICFSFECTDETEEERLDPRVTLDGVFVIDELKEIIKKMEERK